MNRFHTRAAGALLAFLFLFSFEARAQVETRGSTTLSMAGGGPAYVVDNDAMFLNPANLMHPHQRSRGVLTLGSVRLFNGGDLYQFAHYNNTFTGGQTLTDAEVLATLDSWFGADQRHVGVFAESVPLAFSFRLKKQAFGFAVRSRTYSQVGLDRGLFDLVLRGTNESRVIPMNMDMRMATTVDVSLAYSRAFMDGRLLIGLAPKFVAGIEYMNAEMLSTLDIADGALTHAFDYTVQAAGGASGAIADGLNLFASDPLGDLSVSPTLAGQGFGLDVGGTLAVNKGVLVSASVTDLGSVTWSEQAQTITPRGASFHFDGFALDRDRLENDYDNDFGKYIEAQLDSLARDAYAEVDRADGDFTAPLPTAAHVGAAFYAGKAALSLGTSMGLNQAPGNLSQAPSFYAGAEYRLGGRFALPIRTGVRVGGAGALTVGFGFGIHTPIYDLDLSVAATPKTDVMGAGGRYMIALSLGTFRF